MRITIPDLQPGSRYALQFRSKNSSEVSSWSRTFVVDTGYDTTPPAMPTGLSLEVSGDSFLAEWDAVTQNEDGSTMVDFSHYSVRLRNVDNNYSVDMRTDDVKYELTYNLNIALFSPVAGTLGVSVAAVDQTGNVSEYTPEVVRQNPPPGPVRDLVAVGGYDSITSNWNPPADLEDDFKEYRLFISASPEVDITNQSQPVWRGIGTSYVYATATLIPMYVHVVATDKFNSISTVETAGPVEIKSSVEVDIEAPGIPTNLAATIVKNTARVTWTKPTDNDLLGYQIAYRLIGEGWSYVTASHDDEEVSITPVEAYQDYEFRIRAHDTAFNYSGWSSIVTAEGAVNTPPNTPQNVDISGAITSAMVTWDRNTDGDMDFYEVQFGDAMPEEDDQLFSTTATIMGFSENVQEDTMYYARVRAVDTGGLKSDWSPVVQDSVGFVPDLELSDGIPPANSPVVVARGGFGSIFVNWSAIENEDRVTYDIHVGTTAGFVIDEDTLVLSTDSTFAVLRTLPDGEDFSYGTDYFVKAVARDADGSAPAGAASAAVRPIKVGAGDVVTTDGNPPSSSPRPVVSAGIRTFFVTWASITNADPVTYELHVGTSTGFAPSASTRIGEIAGTSMSVGKLPNGNDFVFDTNYFFKTIAKDVDGAAAASPASAGANIQPIANVDVDFDAIAAELPQTYHGDTRPVAPKKNSFWYGPDGQVDFFDGSEWSGIDLAPTIIPDGFINNAMIANAAITTAKIGDAEIIAAKIKDGEITNAKIDTLHGGKIIAGTIESESIKAGSITIGPNSPIAPGTVATPGDIDTALDTAAADAQAKANAAKEAAEQAAADYAEGKIDESALAVAQAAAADAKAKADAAKEEALEAAAAAEQRALSRGTDLVTNGTGYMGDNTNFSGFTVNSDSPPGAVLSFDYDGPAGGRFADELIPVDISKEYRLSFQITQRNPDAVGARHYGMLTPVDSSGATITPLHYMYRPGTTTKLTEPLGPGDTVIHVESTEHWSDDVTSHRRTIIVWDYTDASGKKWPKHTYSRIYRSGAYGPGTLTATTIPLLNPWTGDTHAAGTEISNGSSGGNYIYITPSNQIVPVGEWASFSGTLERGVHDPAPGPPGSTPTTATRQLPPGTAQVRVGWLLNRDVAGSVMSVAAVSFSDAAAAQQLAEEQKELTDGWRWSDTTHIDGGNIYTGTVTAEQINVQDLLASDAFIDNLTVITANLEDAVITTAKIEDAAITTAKIDNLAVTTAKIANLAVDTAKIQDLAVTSAKIKDLEADKLVAGEGIITDLNVKSKLTIGHAGDNNGSIQSHVYTPSAGYELSSNGLTVNSGAIHARALRIQYGSNVMPAAYADFEFAPMFYEDNMNAHLYESFINTSGGRFGDSFARLVLTSNVTLNPTVEFKPPPPVAGGGTGQFNIPIDSDNKYIVSAYVRSQGRVNTNLVMNMYWNTGEVSQVTSLTLTTLQSGWTRIWGVVTPPDPSTTGAYLAISSTTRTAQSGFDIDGIQVEAVTAGLAEPSSWSPPAQTSIDGGAIKTGEIRSTQTINVGGSTQPMWSINMQGGMQIGSANVRGNLTVGASGDTDSVVQSHNFIPYVPGGIRGPGVEGQGWKIQSDGYAEFNNIRVGENSIGPEAINAQELWADDIFANEARLGVLTVGAISPEMINGSEELTVNPTWSRPEFLNTPPFNFVGNGFSWSTTGSYQYEGGNRVLMMATTASASSEVRVTDTNIVSSGEQIYLRMYVRKTTSTLAPINSVGVALKAVWLDQNNNQVHHPAPSDPEEEIPPVAVETNHRDNTWNQYAPYDITVTAPPGATKFYAVITGGNASHAYLVARTSVRRAMSSTTIDGDETVISPQGVQVFGRIESGQGYYERIMLTSMGRMYTAFSPETGETSSMDGDSVSSPVVSGDEVWAAGINVEEEFYDRPRGLVLSDYADQEGSASSEILGYREIGFEAEGGRAYQINIMVDVNAGSQGSMFVHLHKTESETGEAPAPTVNSYQFGRISWRHSGGSDWVHGSFLFVPRRDESTRWLLSTRAGGSNQAKVMQSRMNVIDVGPFTELDDAGRYSNGGATPQLPGPTPPPAPNPAPPKQTRTRTWDFAWNGTYNNFGSDTSPWVPSSKIRQGAAGSSRYKGMLGIQNDTRNTIMGTEIKKIEVYLYHQGPRSNGTVRIGTHRNSSRPSSNTTGGTVYNGYHNVSNWGKNSGKWVTLPSSFHSTFAAGQARGITIGNHTTSMNLMDFAATGNHNAKIRITYTA